MRRIRSLEKHGGASSSPSASARNRCRGTIGRPALTPNLGSPVQAADSKSERMLELAQHRDGTLTVISKIEILICRGRTDDDQNSDYKSSAAHPAAHPSACNSKPERQRYQCHAWNKPRQVRDEAQRVGSETYKRRSIPPALRREVYVAPALGH